MTSEEHQLLVNVLRTSSRTGTHLEIGTGAGGTLCVMLKAFTQEKPPRFVVVDKMRYFENQLELVKVNLAKHGFDENTVEIRVSKSNAAFAQSNAAQERFDFVLIDGSHKIRSVMGDLRWLRLVNVGGLVCLHDYSSRFLGVRLSVNHFLRRYWNYERVAQAGSLLVLRKTALSKRPEVTRFDELYASAWHFVLNLRRSWRGKR